MRRDKADVDVCLVLEGTYPFVDGGVSTWTHDLLCSQPDLRFHLLTLVPEGHPCEYRYQVPPNVVGLTKVVLQALPHGTLPEGRARQLFDNLEAPLDDFLSVGGLDRLQEIHALVSPHRTRLGRRALLNSRPAWNLLLQTYRARFADTSFLDYFWTLRTILGGFFSVLLSDMPHARLYHPVSTGYAGLAAALAHLQTGSPVVLSEHGIYTNERRIEIALANWLYEVPREGLGIERVSTGLKELWLQLFTSYSRTCYEACAQIISLYKGNQSLQVEDGAAVEKLRIIPNGVDCERFGAIALQSSDRPPTVAWIGRVVPIKDVKTFIRGCALLRESVPELQALIMGPTNEDPDYYDECRRMVQLVGLEGCVQFTGKVAVAEYLAKVDVVVLTSISEAQPLVLLEAGAAGIPCVATDVGACRELILGSVAETPRLGAGGAITRLSSPREMAAAVSKLLSDSNWYLRCSKAIRNRVHRYYSKGNLDQSYRELYHGLLRESTPERETVR